MTAQEIIDSFKHQRERYRRMRAEAAALYEAEAFSAKLVTGPIVASSVFLWDDVRKHIAYYLDAVDPKRQTITDEQLYNAG